MSPFSRSTNVIVKSILIKEGNVVYGVQLVHVTNDVLVANV